MGMKKPKKPRQPKVVERDLRAEEAEAAANAAAKANEDAAYRRRAKSRMMSMRASGVSTVGTQAIKPKNKTGA